MLRHFRDGSRWVNYLQGVNNQIQRVRLEQPKELWRISTAKRNIKKKSHASAIQPGKQQKHALQFSFDDIGCRKFQTMVLTLW